MALHMKTGIARLGLIRKSILVRQKSVLKKNKVVKNPPTSRALKYFDDFYQPIFKKKWPSIRLGLLSTHKYCAVLNNYSNVDESIDLLTQLGAVSLRELYEQEVKKTLDLNNFKTIDNNVNEEKMNINFEDKPKEIINDFGEFVPPTRLKGMEDFLDETDHTKHYVSSVEMPFKNILLPPLVFPEHLKIYLCSDNKFLTFPQPKKNSLNVLNYYLMDISSILPPLLLQTKPIDLVLDLCSAPGGKALNVIQSMSYKSLVCNDLQRSLRLKHVFGTYFEDIKKLNVSITSHDAEICIEPNAYTKVLADVPCTNDRDSTVDNENNIFSHARLKERLLLPEKQINILYAGLKAVKVGGAVVYSTCSLSPIQNDGVVHMALNRIYEEESAQFVVNDLRAWIEPWKFLFCFHDQMRYGQLVLPFLPCNAGPTYFCRLERVK